MEIPGDLGDIKNHPCTTCCGSSASCWCVDCSEALCDDCLAAHRRVTLTRSHRVLNHQPEGQSLISPTKFCRNHPSEELQLFCFTCCQLTCRDCQLTEHMSHSFDFVSKAVESVVKQLDACMQPIRAQMEASTRNLQDMETRLQFLTQSEATMTSKLQKNVDTLTSLLKKRFEEITTQIKTVFNVERNMISRKVQRLKQLQKNHAPLSEAVEKARSTSNLPTLVACVSQITSQLKDLEDEDSRPPSRMVNLQVTTNKGAVQGILNFGQIRVSWVPFSVSRVDSPTGSSSSSSSPALSSSHSSISSRPESSNRTGQHQPGPGSGAAPPVRRPASDSEPSSGSRGPAAQSSQPVSSIVIKSKMAQAIETSNPFLYSLLLQTSSSDPPAPSTGPNHHQNPPSYSAPSTGPVHHQNPASYSAPSTGPNHHQNPVSYSAPAPSTGPNHHQNPSYSAPSTGPVHHQNPVSYSAPSTGPVHHQNPASYSAPSTGPIPHQNPSYSAPSTGPIPHQNPSYSAPSTGPVHHQNPVSYSAPSTGPNHHQNPASYSVSSTGPNHHQNPPHNSAPPPAPSTGPVHHQNPPSCSAPPPTSSSSTTPKGSKWKRVGPSVSGGSESSVRINVLTKSQLVSNSGKMFVKFQWKNRVSKSSSSSGSPQKLGGLVRTSTGVQSYRYSTPSTFLILPQSAGAASQPVHPPPILTQHVAPVQNQSISLLRTDAGSDPPPPETFPGNVASVPQSPAAPEVRFGPESVNQLLPEQSPTENLRVQQLKEPEPDQPDPTRPLKGSSEPTETRSEEIQSRETEIIEVLSDDDGEPPAGPAADPTRTPEDPTVLSEEEGSSDGGSLPDVYEVKPGFGEVQTLLEPFTPGASGNEDAAVENEPPPDESKVTGALPGTSEDSVASSEEPELRLKLSSSETSGSEDEDEPSAETWQQDHTQHNWQPTVSLLKLPLSLPGPGRPLPRYHFILGNQKDELYLQEVEDDSQSSCEDVSETASDHASDVTEDFTEVHSPESPLCLEVISCAACGSSSASKICTLCGRGYHRDCHVPPFGPDIWSELVCSLCQDLTDPSDPYSADRPKSPQSSALSLQDQRKCETLLLHLKVEGCRRLSQLDLWSDLMLISERLSLHLSPPYQTPAQVVSDLWDLFANASQGDALTELQRSFQKKLEETFGSDLPPSLLTAPAADAPRGPEGPSGSPGARGGESKLRDLRKRLRDFLDLKGPSAAKRPKTEKPEDASWSDGKNEGGAGSS